MTRSNPASELDRFLDSCALTYSAEESPVRIEAAAALLRARPGLARESLFAAAAVGDGPGVRDLLQGADPNARGGPRDWPPLLYLTYSRVVTGSAVEAARLLLEAGADADAVWWWDDQYRFTALTGAFGEGELGPIAQPEHPEGPALARLLLEHGALPADGQGLYNRMFTGSPQPLRLLLDFGLAIDAPANWRTAPGGAPSEFEILPMVLRWDVEHGHLERLGVLLEAGVDPALAAKDGHSAWRQAALHGQREARLLLEAHGCGPETLEPHEELARGLLEGEDPGPVDEELLASCLVDVPLVHRAVQGRRDGVLERLLALGVSPGICDARGVPALHEAAHLGALEAVRALLAAGADPAKLDGAYGGTAWGWARHAHHPGALEILDAFGPEP